MAVGVERDVQDMLLGQRKTKRGQGKVPYPIAEYTTDLANLSVSLHPWSATFADHHAAGIFGTTCSSKISGAPRLYITFPLNPAWSWTSDAAQDGGLSTWRGGGKYAPLSPVAYECHSWTVGSIPEYTIRRF